MQRAEESLHEVEHLTYETNAADGVRVVRTNGRYSIEFLAGGQIRFGGPASSSSLWGRSGARGTSRQIDTHIMDDVLSEAHPDATRVYRALLR